MQARPHAGRGRLIPDVTAAAPVPGPARPPRRRRARRPARRGRPRRRRRLLPGDLPRRAARLSEARARRQPARLADDDRPPQGGRPPPRQRAAAAAGRGGRGDRGRARRAPEPDAGVWARVGALPPKQRAAVTLRYAGDLPHAEIAAALGCSPEAARRSLHEGIKRLRKELA